MNLSKITAKGLKNSPFAGQNFTCFYLSGYYYYSEIQNTVKFKTVTKLKKFIKNHLS